MKISIEKIELELKVNWKLSRNETLLKENFILRLEKNNVVGLGEVAPNIRYDETPIKIQQDFQSLLERSKNETISDILKDNSFCNSFNFALDSAHIHLKSLLEDKKIYELLDLEKPLELKTSYTVPIMDESKLENYLDGIKQFDFIKVKVNKDNAISFCQKIGTLTNKKLRIDGNEAWDSIEEYLIFENAIRTLNVEFIEQPFCSSRSDLYLKLRPISKFLIMADESITSCVDFNEIEKCFHGVNIKLMKARSFSNAIVLLKEAKRRNLKTMLGCMIETSLGISYAMNLYELVDYFDLDGSLLIKNDPFNLITLDKGKLYLRS